MAAPTLMTVMSSNGAVLPAECEGARSSKPLVPKWFINVKTNVIHETRNDDTFRCGRPRNSVYVAVPALTGLRCGQCFAHVL